MVKASANYEIKKKKFFEFDWGDTVYVIELLITKLYNSVNWQLSRKDFHV